MLTFLLAAALVATEKDDVKVVKRFDHLGRQWVVSSNGTFIKMKETYHKVEFSKKPIKDVIKKKDDSIIIVYDPAKVPKRGVSANSWAQLYFDIENGFVANPNLPEIKAGEIHPKVLKEFK